MLLPYLNTTAISLLDILNYRVQNQAEQHAYIFLQNGETEKASLTYRELHTQARNIASHLQSWTGERALLLYPSGLEFITAFFGCLYAGVVAVPVYPPKRNQKLSRLLAIAKDAQAQIALTTASILGDIENKWQQEAELAPLNLIATDTIARHPGEFEPQGVTAETLAFLQYTSGATGTPKGVMVTHGNIIHNQQLIQTAFGHSQQSIGVGWLPLFHDMGLIGNVLQPMYLGFPFIFMPPEVFLQKPIRWLEVISRYRATTSGGPNFAYDLCAKKIQPEELAHLDLSSWDVAFNGAEPVRAETLAQFSEKFASCGFKHKAFYPCYGMAETTLLVTGGDKQQQPVIKKFEARELEKNLVVEVQTSSTESREIVGCGHPQSDTKVVIVNPESLKECEPGQIGEIWVSSTSVAAGYWQRPQATQETFQAVLQDQEEIPFLRTGDLGFISQGELFITGRLKDIIIIRGRNHYPQDIELTVEKSHPGLRANSGAAFTVEIEGKQKLVVGQEIERTYLRHLNSDEVVEAINQAVAREHELAIDTIVFLKPGSIPKTSSGKIQRRACRQMFLAGTWTELAHKRLLVASVRDIGQTLEAETALLNPKHLTELVNSWQKSIGDVEQSLHLQENTFDELLRVQPPGLLDSLVLTTSQNKSNTTDEINHHEGAKESFKNEGYKPLENHLIHDINYMRNVIKNTIAKKLNINAQLVKSDATFVSYGIDSMKAIDLIQSLENQLGQPLEPTIIWNYSTIESLAEYLTISLERTQELGEVNKNLLVEKNKLEQEDRIQGKI